MGVTGWGFYRAYIRCGAQVFYIQIYLQFVPRSDDSVRICKRGKIPDSVLIRMSTPWQLRILLGPWFRLLQRHNTVLKAGRWAADGSWQGCRAAAAQGFKRWHVALWPWAEWATTQRENEPRKLASRPRREVKLRKEKEMERAGWRLLAQNSCRRKKDPFLFQIFYKMQIHLNQIQVLNSNVFYSLK
jgi:hypothetical protein